MIADTLLSHLKDPSICTDEASVGGRWVGAREGGRSFKVEDPATGELVAVLPDLGPSEVARAVDAAYAAQKSWAARSAKERAGVMRKVSELMREHADDLARILIVEMGKPLAESRGEIAYGASYFEWFGEEAKRTYGDVIPGPESDKRVLVIKQPVGVVAAITPWNFPNAMLSRKVAPALAVGCAIVAKPAAETPLSALALARICERAGVPSGLLSVVTSTDAPAVGREMCENPKVRKLTFTGSTQVGKQLLRQAADQVLKVSLELGGNAPFLVFDDADLDAAVEGAMVSKFRNNGQTCVCANRLYVQSGVYDEFASRLADKVRRIKVGNGLDGGVTAGPLISAKALAKVEEHVSDARSKGASVLEGGRRASGGDLFFEPTILTGVTSAMRISVEETFGPVAPLFRFETEEEAIRMANDTEFGLASYLYTRDASRVFRVSEALEYGMVGVNTGLISSEVAPFVGIKQSGQGREGSLYGADDYLEMKYLCLSIER